MAKEQPKCATQNGKAKSEIVSQIARIVRKHGLDYETETWTSAKEKSKSFIEEVGIDGALEAVRQNQVDDAAAAFIWSDIIDGVGKRKSNT